MHAPSTAKKSITALPQPHRGRCRRIRLALVALMLVGGAVHLQAEQVTRHRIAGGGGTSAAGAYTLSGTFAQPEAAVSSAAGYRLQGGFWIRGSAADAELFADGFE